MRIGRDSSLLAARSTWTTACRNVAAGSVTPAAGGSPRRGKSSTEKGRTENDERSDVISTASPPASTTTAPAASVRTASAVEPAGHHARTVALAVDLDGPLDRQLEVGPGDLEVVALEHQAHAGQHRLRSGPPLRGSGRGGQGLPEHVTFAAELHCAPSLSCDRRSTSTCSSEPSSSNWCCGLWTTAPIGPGQSGCRRPQAAHGAPQGRAGDPVRTRWMTCAVVPSRGRLPRFVPRAVPSGVSSRAVLQLGDQARSPGRRPAGAPS